MKRRWIGLFLTAAILLSCIGATVYAADGHTYYSQKGWKYNGKNLTSMCYATCIAMSLSDLGKSVTPLDIYINNGYTAYCKANAATAKDFGVSWKKLVDNAGSMSADAKKAKLIQLLGTGDYPQGIMLYGGGHMILARKVENGVVYFDDPVYGCCLPIEKCDKTRYSNITLMGCFYNNNLTQNPEGSTPLSPNPFYTIRNVGSDKMLNIRGNSSASNTNVTVYQADGTTGQMFQWIDNGNGCYVIEPQCAPSCALNVYGSYSTDGSNVTTWTKTGHSTQSWTVAYNSSLNGYVIRSADNEDYVLTAAGSTNSSNVQLAKFDPANTYQVWTSDVFSQLSVADVSAPAPTMPAENPANSEKSVSVNLDSFITVKNLGSDKMLNIRGNSSQSNANVTVYQADGTNGQRFKFISNGFSGYEIEPECAPSCALNVRGESSKAGSNVTTWTKTGHSTQTWIVTYNSTLSGYVIRSADNPDFVLTATGSANSSNVELGQYDPSNSYQVWTSEGFSVS